MKIAIGDAIQLFIPEELQESLVEAQSLGYFDCHLFDGYDIWLSKVRAHSTPPNL